MALVPGKLLQKHFIVAPGDVRPAGLPGHFGDSHPSGSACLGLDDADPVGGQQIVQRALAFSKVTRLCRREAQVEIPFRGWECQRCSQRPVFRQLECQRLGVAFRSIDVDGRRLHETCLGQRMLGMVPVERGEHLLGLCRIGLEAMHLFDARAIVARGDRDLVRRNFRCEFVQQVRREFDVRPGLRLQFQKGDRLSESRFSIL